jgi:hypothetical protein
LKVNNLENYTQLPFLNFFLSIEMIMVHRSFVHFPRVYAKFGFLYIHLDLSSLVMAMKFEIRGGIVRKGELSWVGALLLPNTNIGPSPSSIIDYRLRVVELIMIFHHSSERKIWSKWLDFRIS